MSSQARRRTLQMSSLALRVLLGLGVLGAGVGIAAALIATKPNPPTKPVNANALTVGTVPATTIELPREWHGYGTARAMTAADLAAEVSGRAVERPEAVEAGAPIAAGELIVQLERTDFEARLRAAREAVTQAEADLATLEVDEASWERQLELVEEQAAIERRELQQALTALESGAATSSEIDRRTKALRVLESQVSATRQQLERVPSVRQSRRAALERARAEATLTEENLRRTTIRSPISGVLQRVEVEEGELVPVGAPVARVVDLSRVEVPLRIPASAFGHVRVGDEALLRPDGPSTKDWTGRVARMAPEADPQTRTLTVFVEVRQDPGAFERGGGETLLLPGEFVTGAIVGSRERARTVVPRRAVQEGSIFVAEPVEGGAWAARRLEVDVLFHTSAELPQIDALERQWAVLETALPPGTPVIVTNLDELTEGRFVEHRTRPTAAGGGP